MGAHEGTWPDWNFFARNDVGYRASDGWSSDDILECGDDEVLPLSLFASHDIGHDLLRARGSDAYVVLLCDMNVQADIVL